MSTALLAGLLLGCRPVPTTTPSRTVGQADSPAALPTFVPNASTEVPVGVQVFEADVDTPALDHLRAAGVSWARTRALWKAIEPVESTPPRYDWAMTDALLGATTDAGFRNLTVVYANPAWAAETECGPVRREKLARYAAFWRALVERYDGDRTGDAPNGAVAAYWEVGNEPDFDPTVPASETDYGGCFGDNPAAYAEQLVAAYGAAREADAAARVGFGGVAYDRFTAASAPAGWSSRPGPFARDFTASVLEELARRYPGDARQPFSDFVGLHHYNDSADFWESPPRHDLSAKLSRFRGEQLAMPGVFDWRSLPILITETGLAASPSDEWTERSEALQAIYAVQSMVRAIAGGAAIAVWYTARDNIFGDCVPPHYDWLTFGLMRSPEYKSALDGRCPNHDWAPGYETGSRADPRPALDALATLTRALGGADFDRQLDDAETGIAAIEAYRFVRQDAESLIVAWTTTGDRLGRRGVTPIEATLELDPARLPPWTGQVSLVGHLGDASIAGEPGASRVTVAVSQAPVYLSPHRSGSRLSR